MSLVASAPESRILHAVHLKYTIASHLPLPDRLARDRRLGDLLRVLTG